MASSSSSSQARHRSEMFVPICLEKSKDDPNSPCKCQIWQDDCKEAICEHVVGVHRQKMTQIETKITKEIADFFQSLYGAKMEGKLVSVKSKILGDEQYGSHLYARSAYVKLAELINQAKIKNRLVLILGTPGTGKSMFSLYLLKFLIDGKQTVVYERRERESRTRILFDNGRTEFGSGKEESFRGYLSEKTTWYLFDGAGPGKDEPPYRTSAMGPIVVFASPRKYNYDEYIKEKPAIFWMPLWDECQHLRMLTQCHASVTQLSYLNATTSFHISNFPNKRSWI